ncbi:MAG: hypothetical protein JXA13_11835 [Anaerolineales bacterium]|nr:hypothetical protein [Anaerolineales bacterium]
MINKKALKTILGEVPLTAEIDWLLRQRNRSRKDHFSLDRLSKTLPDAAATARPFAEAAPRGKKILLFAVLHYWIEQLAYLSLTLSGQGHQVTLMTLPYSEWNQEKDKFTQRQRILHTREALKPLATLVEHVPFLGLKPASTLPEQLDADIAEISLWDAQYTLMREEVDREGKDRQLYQLRIRRNQFAARAALAWMQDNRPDAVLVPNGLILEMGVVYRVAKFLGIPVMTFEFNDQREQIWLAQNSSIMRQDTDFIWEARQDAPITETHYKRVADLENARRGARVWGKSKRLWQYVSSQGADVTRRQIGLDKRPIVMLAANVLGDSLTLGRNVFAESMSEWLTKTVQFLADRTEIQFVIRVHPGEMIVPQAKSMGQVVWEALPAIPEHIHVIAPDDKVNTYDLIEIADLGLVYTTTVGLEMAMNGRPVICCGHTHYRGRGFTIDPNNWDAYFKALKEALADIPGHRLGEKQIKTAWNYAYRFFFEYPLAFPWRLMGFWEDLEVWPLERVLGPEGRAEFGDTFRFLVGEPYTWKD